MPKPEEPLPAFDVILVAVGSKKIHAIKEVRALTGRSMIEGKDFIESLPRVLVTNVSWDRAVEIIDRFTLIEASASFRDHSP